MNDSPVHGSDPRSFLPKVWATPPGVNDYLCACMFVPDPANVDLFPSFSGGSRKQERGFQTIEREARKIWGYAHFRCNKTRENPILSQGKSHLRLWNANSQLASLGSLETAPPRKAGVWSNSHMNFVLHCQQSQVGGKATSHHTWAP